jgi:bifunctional DNA-binding transcriptional regulator/antitoxin component of YhaV-PrlF toxin-antitoxin module
VRNGVIIVAALATGEVALSGRGRVHLPAATRHACRISPGDRVLLAAEPADGVLMVHPLPALDAMLAHYRDHVMAGEPA